jgi:aminoglycoside phosphotransferase (APT) family kinase protein
METVVDVELASADLEAAFGRPVPSYTVTAIDPQLRLHSVTGGVWRVRAGGDSLVVKVVRHGGDDGPDGLWVAGDSPEHRNYWKREWLAYAAGMLDTLPGGLRAPRTALTTEPSDDECWIWMEDVEGTPGTAWELDDFDAAGFDLATTQAAYATGRSELPDQPWLARRWLRGWVEVSVENAVVIDDDRGWDDDRLAALRPLRARAAAVWDARDELLAIVEAAPQTVTHCDLWPANLIAADDGTTVAIDWSQVGIGALAQDLDQLTLDTVWMHVRPQESLDALEAHVLPPYLSGLKASGVDVDERQLRQWYAAAASVHYVPMLAYQAGNAADPARVLAAEQRFGRSLAEQMADRSRVVERAVTLGERALESAS